MRPAVAYLRTSSAANVGEDKDSHKRQLAAIEAYADRAGLEIVATFYDAAVSGADALDARPGFMDALGHVGEHDVRTIVVETANRFARDLIVQEAGFAKLKEAGIELIAADDPDAFTADTPTAIMVRQILGAVSQFEKASIVAKLKGARDRVKAQRGKCEGRKSHREMRPETVRLAQALRPGRSLRAVAVELEARGHLNERGRPFNPASISAMLSDERTSDLEDKAA
ncbi:MAG: recombinase family protein [Pseudomonadota bacterium]